jgi:hypothetical protein
MTACRQWQIIGGAAAASWASIRYICRRSKAEMLLRYYCIYESMNWITKPNLSDEFICRRQDRTFGSARSGLARTSSLSLLSSSQLATEAFTTKLEEKLAAAASDSGACVTSTCSSSVYLYECVCTPFAVTEQRRTRMHATVTALSLRLLLQCHADRFR